VRNHLLLQLVVLGWAFTAILGKLIQLPVLDMIVWRAGLASLGFAAVAWWLGQPLRISRAQALRLIAMGAVMGLHWVLFFHAGRISTASVSLAALPTLMIWCSVLEPLLDRSKSLQRGELVVGVVIVAAVWLIYQVEFRFAWGFTLSLLSVGLAALFAVVNRRWSAGNHFSTLLAFLFWRAAGSSLCLAPWTGAGCLFFPWSALWALMGSTWNS
jgi:drug/metabolite transporter (DMT)-like permease